MKHFSTSLRPLAATALAAVLAGPAIAAEGNWRVGRIYYRMVCTACHVEATGESIAPSTRTKAEWTEYLAADQHATNGQANPSLRYYVSQEYRASIKDTNKAAAKFIDIPNEEMFANLEAFVIRGAQDSDTPAGCQ